MGILTTPVTSRVPKALHYRDVEDDGVIIDSNAIPPEISQYLIGFFSRLTPNKFKTLIESRQWAVEKPYEFPAEPYLETRVQGYQELYNDFLLHEKNKRI